MFVIFIFVFVIDKKCEIGKFFVIVKGFFVEYDYNYKR